MIPVERTHEFRGRYHVLGGALSPIDGIDPEDLKIDELYARVSAADPPIREIVLATNPTTTGEATALHIARGLHERAPELAVTRLASGLPVGVGPGVRRRGHARPRDDGPPRALNRVAIAAAARGPTETQHRRHRMAARRVHHGLHGDRRAQGDARARRAALVVPGPSPRPARRGRSPAAAAAMHASSMRAAARAARSRSSGRSACVIGVDASPLAVDATRRRGLEAHQGLVETLPFADASFDLVTCLDVVEHTPDDVRTLTELRRVTRPGGHVVVTVPAYQALWSHHDVVNLHYRRYGRASLRTAARDAGFDVVHETSFNSRRAAARGADPNPPEATARDARPIGPDADPVAGQPGARAASRARGAPHRARRARAVRPVAARRPAGTGRRPGARDRAAGPRRGDRAARRADRRALTVSASTRGAGEGPGARDGYAARPAGRGVGRRLGGAGRGRARAHRLGGDLAVARARGRGASVAALGRCTQGALPVVDRRPARASPAGSDERTRTRCSAISSSRCSACSRAGSWRC